MVDTRKEIALDRIRSAVRRIEQGDYDGAIRFLGYAVSQLLMRGYSTGHGA